MKKIAGLMALVFTCLFSCTALYAMEDEGGTMGSADIGDYDDDGATTEDRTLAPNEYNGSENAEAGVAVEEEIPIGGSAGE